MRRAFLAIAFVLSCLAVPDGALAAAPANGQGYYGTSEPFTVFVEVNRSGTRLANYDLGGYLRCSNGRRTPLTLFARGEKPTVIAADGSFSYSSPTRSFTARQGLRRPVRGRVQTSFTGSFASADQATVSVTTTFPAKGLSCSGTSTFPLSRAGTPGAPFRDAAMATGTYSAAGRGIRVTSLQTLAPGDLLERFRFRTSLRCSNRTRYPTSYNFDGFGVGRDHVGRFRDSTRFSFRDGFRGRERARIVIAFSLRGGVYRVRGTVRLRTTVTRAGRRVGRCSATRRFSGRFVSGPS